MPRFSTEIQHISSRCLELSRFINKSKNNIQKDLTFIYVEFNYIDMSDQHTWIQLLEDEDLAFLKRFVVASGSLKELAGAYGISYPTVRLRLDRLIAKIKVYDSQNKLSDFERTVRAMHAGGRIDVQTMKALLTAHQQEMENTHEATASDRPGAAPR